MTMPVRPRSRCVADLPAVLGPADCRAAVRDMVTYGGFRDTAALARWSKTAEAQPVLRQWREWRCKPGDGEYFSALSRDTAAEDAEMEALAAKIEAEFGAS